MKWNTADLCDEFAAAARVFPPVFHNYGSRQRFSGRVVTLKCFEDNALIKQTLATSGKGKVLLVDGGGSLRCALFGDVMAKIARDAGWEGAVIFGCIRDTAGILVFDVGVRALAVNPRRPAARGEGELDLALNIAGVPCMPGERLFADEDGIVVLDASCNVRGAAE